MIRPEFKLKRWPTDTGGDFNPSPHRIVPEMALVGHSLGQILRGKSGELRPILVLAEQTQRFAADFARSSKNTLVRGLEPALRHWLRSGSSGLASLTPILAFGTRSEATTSCGFFVTLTVLQSWDPRRVITVVLRITYYEVEYELSFLLRVLIARRDGMRRRTSVG